MRFVPHFVDAAGLFPLPFFLFHLIRYFFNKPALHMGRRGGDFLSLFPPLHLDARRATPPPFCGLVPCFVSHFRFFYISTEPTPTGILENVRSIFPTIFTFFRAFLRGHTRALDSSHRESIGQQEKCEITFFHKLCKVLSFVEI